MSKLAETPPWIALERDAAHAGARGEIERSGILMWAAWRSRKTCRCLIPERPGQPFAVVHRACPVHPLPVRMLT